MDRKVDGLERRTLGETGLSVTALGLGCASLGGLYGDIPEEQAVEVVHRALSLGVNLFDTAPLYGRGKSERRLGRALQGVPRDRYVLATKVGRLLRHPEGSSQASSASADEGLEAVFDFSYEGVMRSFEESLARLQLDRVDILHIHDPDRHYEQAMEGAYRALDDLRSQGVIRAVSAGMNQSAMLARFAREGRFDCFLLAGRYSLLEQGPLDELLPLCVEKGIGILAGGTYNSGILATGPREGARYNYREAPPEIRRKAADLAATAERHSVDLKAAASQFVLAHPAVVSIIPGTRRPERVEENLRSLGDPIPGTFWAELKERGLLRPEAPVPSGR
jgi:D-threo-aldose 1-dehydrogenase